MSVEASSWAWEQACTPSEKLVLLAIADHDKHGYSWPGLKRLAEKTGYTERNVRNVISRLVARGLIAVDRNRRRTGSSRGAVTHGYQLKMEDGAMPPAMFPQEKSSTENFSPENCDVQPEHSAVQPENRDRLTGKLRHRIKGIEPSENRKREPSEGEYEGKHTQPWNLPDWFTPLTTLPGYRRSNHARAAQRIAETCAEANVDPAEVVRVFAASYPTLRHSYGWHDPVATLKGRPLQIAISQVLSGERHTARDRPRRTDIGVSSQAELERTARWLAEVQGGR